MSAPAGPVAFLVQRIGPYHDARLSAWSRISSRPVHALEFRTHETVYAWAPVDGSTGYARTRCPDRAGLIEELDRLRPSALVCVGYSDTEIHTAILWALKRRVPLVTCSDSTYDDEQRTRLKEYLKRKIVTTFDAAIVAGTKAREYLAHLGIEDARQFMPWDVVDNAYFSRGAAAARQDAVGARRKLRLPTSYFLCVARFVPKKNLETLILAFAQFHQLPAARAGFSLVLSGSGPLEPALRRLVAENGLDDHVTFVGFLQYPDLPACYALSSALVLPSLSDQWGLVVNEAMACGVPVVVSSACGCAPDLVRNGETGWTFAPRDVQELAGRLATVAELSPDARVTLGEHARRRVEVYSPGAFASAAEEAVQGARRHARRPSVLSHLILRGLTRRSRPKGNPS